MAQDGPTASSRAIDPTVVVTKVFARGGAGSDPRERAGTRIGEYELLQQLGEGGFGTVWLAERREPMVQRVALKLIKPGMDSRAVVARFEQERQALAVMDHPNVAKVFDAGVTSAELGSRPYFVMELVQGEPITDFCDRHTYTNRQRLELFIPVCDAVQHAHAKGIIHRDIKPSNILVTIRDERPIPKVIDFGVAKAISRTLTEKTIFTEAGLLIGTPEYMSPEQAEMGALDIDTRTDVYSLGVVLYELLTGLLPFDSEELRSKGYAEIQRIIREVDPPTPSKRLTTIADASGAELARRRQAQRDAIARELRRELEWVPLKAMRKDRTQRYASPEAIARDIRRFLAGETLDAGPPSAAYRARKFFVRNRAAVLASAAVLAAILAGGSAAAWFGVQESKARRLVTIERDTSDAVLSFVNDDLFGATDGWATPTVPLSDVVDRAASPDALARLEDRPHVLARVRAMLGRSYIAAGQPARGEPLLRASLEGFERAGVGAGDEAFDASCRLAEALWRGGRGREAEELLRERIASREARTGADDVRLLNARNQLAGALKREARVDEAEAIYGDVLARREKVLGGSHEDTIITRFNLALTLLRRGQAMREHGDEGGATAQYERASTAMRELWERCKRERGATFHWTLAAGSEHASLLNRLGRLGEARPIFAEVVPQMRDVLGPRHFRTLEAQANFGRLLQKAGDHGLAIEQLEPALAGYREVRGGDYPDTLTITGWLVDSLLRVGEHARAMREAEMAWEGLIVARAASEKRSTFAKAIAERIAQDAGVEQPSRDAWARRADGGR